MTRRHTPERLTLDAILPHLRTKRVAKRNSERHVLAHCPAHDDSTPSLSLTEKADGTLLWKCFAGCSQDAVREALERLAGVQPATARPIAPRRNRQQPATAQAQPLTLAALADAKRLDAEKLIAWHVRELPDGGIEILYLTREGELHAIQYRLAQEGENRFKWRKDDTAILYGLWRLPEWGDADTLYLCEGTSDTWTLWHADLPALGIPSASTWREEWWREVEGFPRIVLIPDADGAGAGLAQKLAETCPDSLRERVQVLQLPEGAKDANELWQQVDADPERFREALAGCEIILLTDSYRNQNRRINGDLPLLAPLSELLSSNAEHELEYVPLLGVDGLIARGTLTLIGAHPKAGKTTLLIHACREWLQRGLRVVYLSEDSRAIWRERVKRFPELSALILNAIPRAHPENWARAVREEEPDIVVVDTIRRFLPPNDENDAASVAAALAPFVDLTEQLPRTAIVLVHHTKKSLSSDGEITDIAGSHAFTAEVDTILLLAPVREQKQQRLLVPIAGRAWTLSPEPLVLELSEDGVEYRVVGIANEVLPETHARSTKEKILHALRMLGTATAEEVVEYLRSSGEMVASSHVRNLLAELVHEGVVEREGDGKRGSPYTYSVSSDVLIPIESDRQNKTPADGAPVSSDVLIPIEDGQQNNQQNKTPADAPPEPTPYDPRSESFEEWLARADTVLDPFYPAFHARAELTWDTIDDWLQQASMPHDPLGLEPHEVDALRVLLAFAEARGFPPLTIPAFGYTIRAGQAGWLNALPDIAGTPAVALATCLLQSLDAAGSPDAPTPTFTNGNAGLTPLQFTLIQEV
jgi:predicted transcriptional regulator